MAVDLHTHTNFSDGSLSPQELVEKANAYKLKAIAITDHDEIAANPIAIEHARQYPVDIVPGVEFSIDIELSGTAHLHLLGLFLDVNDPLLTETLDDLRLARKNRIRKILNKLNELGYKLQQEELDQITGQGSAGRPHIAQLLMNNNIVSSVWEAFHKFLSRDKVAYVPKKKLKLEDAINLIHHSKGLAILAHPISLRHTHYTETEAFLKELKTVGLDGVEAYYTTHSKNFTKYLIKAARRNNLLISGGSDFHGINKPDTDLGRGKGQLEIPDQVYFDLQNAARSKS